MNNSIVNNATLLAIATGTETVEMKSFPKYVGMGAFTVASINPNKAMKEALLDREFEEEPVYVTVEDDKDKDGNVIGIFKQANLTIYLRTIPEKCNGVEMILPIYFNIQDKIRINQAGDKAQCVNAYGEFTWLTQENLKTKVAPASMSFYDMTSVRPAYVGEEDLVLFIKAFLNIKGRQIKNKEGNYVNIDNLGEAMCQLDNIKDMFNGDFKEVIGAINSMPNNKIKLALGVKSVEGKEYQKVLTKKPYKYNNNNIEALEKFIKNEQEEGRLSDIYYGNLNTFAEYSVQATSFANNNVVQEDPFGAPSTDDNFGW